METLIEDKIDTISIDDVLKTEPQFDISNGVDVSVIILLVNNEKFKTVEKSYNLEIYGKKMWEWVALATTGYPMKKVECIKDNDIISLIRPLLTKTKYTAVFYSDTPLLKRKTFLEIMDYVRVRDINVCKLTRGFVFNTEFIKNNDKIYSIISQVFDEEDFITAFDMRQLTFINDIFKSRICAFHEQNGVQIIDANSCYIEADVIIEPNVIIYPNNSLIGKTYIGKNVVLKPNNVIENSIINENCKIISSVIRNTKIQANSNIGPFEKR